MQEITREQVRQIGADVAAALTTETGDRWVSIESSPDYPGVYLTRVGDSARLYFRPSSVYTERGRLYAVTTRPADVDDSIRRGKVENARAFHVKDKRATFAADRTPRAIAKDIVRKVLPGLTEETKRVRDAVAKHIAEADQAQANADELSHILHGKPARNHRGEPETSLYWNPSGMNGYLRGEVSDTSVSLDRGWLPMDKARQVAVVLAGDVVVVPRAAARQLVADLHADANAEGEHGTRDVSAAYRSAAERAETLLGRLDA